MPYFWKTRKGAICLEVPQFYFGLPNLCDPLRGFGKTPTVDVLATAPRLRTFVLPEGFFSDTYSLLT